MLQMGRGSPECGCCEPLEESEPQSRHAELQLEDNKHPQHSALNVKQQPRIRDVKTYSSKMAGCQRESEKSVGI